jgi:hypothetical protein
MTKLEALAKDCIENHTHKLVDKPTKQDIYLREESIFIQGYRQSEKRITELEAQIEKMKSCQNCKFEDLDCFTEPCPGCFRLFGEDIKREGTSDKWEIKEND